MEPETNWTQYAEARPILNKAIEEWQTGGLFSFQMALVDLPDSLDASVVIELIKVAFEEGRKAGRKQLKHEVSRITDW